jgi:hypothetical protein
MTQFFNIARKIVVNPLEKIMGFTITCNTASEKYDLFHCDSVPPHLLSIITIDSRASILYPIALLDFIVMLQWYDETSGRIQVKRPNGSTTWISFRIYDNILVF